MPQAFLDDNQVKVNKTAVSRHNSSISLEKTATSSKKNKKAGKGKHNKVLERQNQSNLTTNGDSSQVASTQNTTSFRMKFKTEICKFWQLHGFCEYGEACSFAHGSEELLVRKD